MTLPNCII